MSLSLAGPPATKPRNKLRKAPKRARIVSSSVPLTPRLSVDTSKSGSGSSERRSPVPGLSPPDLSDTKWEDFVRQSGYLLPMTKSPRLEQIDNLMSSSSTTTASQPPAACAEQKPPTTQQQQLVPEFAHLAVTSAAGSDAELRPPSRNPRRQSLSGSTRAHPMRSPSSSSTSTTASSDSAASKRLRRYSKTPVLRIGQLESLQQQQRPAAPPSPEEQQQVVAVVADDDEPKTPPTPPVPRRSARRSSTADKMAEQYHSLLHSPTCARLRMEYEAHEEKQGEVPAESAQIDFSATRLDSIEAIRSAIARRSPVQQRQRMVVTPPLAPSSLEDIGDEPPEGSPTSDGTLVGFEEDAIYFKPSFTPDGVLTPIPEDECYDTPLESPQGEMKVTRHDDRHDDNISLQICVNLLVNELRSVMERRDSGYEGASPDEDHVKTTPPLQIWLMIEAYDRLREQMSAKDTDLSPCEAKSLEAMFETWIKALHRVHEKVADENVYTA